jgi:nicotinamidase/pyrazinamidase
MDGLDGLVAGDALLIVDVQNDFLPGGALPVPEGDRVVPALNRAIAAFRRRRLPILTTRDWHPPGHCSFQPRGGPWPIHCLQESWGARFAPNLRLPPDIPIIAKGAQPDRDAYSGFQGTDLDRRLRAMGATRLVIGGLATDYCVLQTVQDARALGYQVCVLTDAIRAVNVHPDDGRRALEAMARAGAVLIPSETVRDASRSRR